MSAKAYMSDEEARKAILDIGRRMYTSKMVAANDGNISVKVGENALWCTPTGVSKGFVKKRELIKLDLDGNVLKGRLKPSSELKMHLRCYRENAEIRGVCHAHPPVATSYAIAGIPLDLPILPEAIVNLGLVPVAPYARPGSDAVPDSVAGFVRDYNALLLANHGALTWGHSVYEAYYRMETLEHYATILMYTQNVIGSYNTLDNEQINELIAIRESQSTSADKQ